MRILGIDYGTKKIGIAISDETNTIALPHGVIDTDGEYLDKIKEIVKKNKITRIVVGMPITLKGEKGKRALETEDFINELACKIENIEIVEWDERLSTRFSERILNKANVKGRKNKKKVIDKIAATFILQGYLDSLI
ncbi:Holliday junction resolvase RuvX [Hippea maritima]|uniref:Putative pre-16S rRNA nuclease n=1 Tax=Hippea maritima (strain ATCC 700847 / DSM 10411 / MH2) TaxID=760142 RepID=F2LWN3_HIPMA|nr:Holliday junction resolvase RuvX [Hippea maritima]AEA33011.1 Holliday junction resolvase [Hippea maritima DSM 10411]